MGDATSAGALPSSKPKNDEDLPAWLMPMIGYLRGVAEDPAWQDLVTIFVDVEKSKCPIGVSHLHLPILG